MLHRLRFGRQSCTPGNETAPVYRTSMTQEKSTCLSRCGRFEYKYEWCFVSNEKQWDYCNSDTEIVWTKGQQYTLNFGPCADECKMDLNKQYMCSNYNGYTYECNPRRYPYVQARTWYGEKCVSDCWRYDTGDHHLWCHDPHSGQEYCAPPAKPPALNEFVNVPVRKDCINISRRKMNFKKFVECNVNVSTTADKLEGLNYYHTENVNEHRNPVYRYTTLPPTNPNDRWLPLVIKAKVTAETIRCCVKTKQETNDAGFIVGNLIGGDKKQYNIVTLRKSSDKTLREYENKIFKWVSQHKTNTVEITVLVMYKESKIPYAFGVDYNFLQNGKIWYDSTIRDVIIYNV